MRIAMLTHQWPGARMGGIGSYVRQCAAALARAGQDVHVFTFTLPADARANVPPGVIVQEIDDLATRVQNGALPGALAAALSAGGEGIYRLAMGWLLCEALLTEHRRKPFDVVETPEVEALGLPLLLIDADVPVVTQLHCCTAIAYLGNETPVGQEQRLITELEFALMHLSDAICAPTRAVEQVTRSLTPLRNNVTLIPHAYVADDRPFSPPPVDGAMVFIGRIERLKGVQTIAEALNVFLPKHPHARFEFIGPDTSSAPGGKSMRQHIQSLLHPEIVGRVEFCGELGRATVEAELQAASFCVMPSLYENFSMACCEAMNAGRTLIVGAGTGSVEVVGDAGVVVERGLATALAAAMDDLWSNRPRLAALSQKAHQRIRSVFQFDDVTARRLEFYRTAAHQAADRDLSRALATLPPSCAPAVLPSLATVVGMLSGVTCHGAKTPGTRLLAIMDKLKLGGAQIILYGAGKHTARLLAERHLWESRGHRITGIIDDHPRFAEQPQFMGFPVRSLARTIESADRGEPPPAVVLSTDTYEDQFWAQTAPLRAHGVRVFRLYGS